MSFRLRVSAAALLVLLGAATALRADYKSPVLIGVNAEFGLPGSTSAQAIERGARVAVEEINRAGGVLGGRPLSLMIKDNRSVPARGLKNFRELAETPDMVAVFTGRFSPVVIEAIPFVQENKLIVLAPWSSADAITDGGQQTSYLFRLSLRDSYAMPAMLAYLAGRKIQRVGLLLLGTAWGRSNLAAAQRYVGEDERIRVVGTEWFAWQDVDIVAKYQSLSRAGAEAIVLVANDDDAVTLVNAIPELPIEERIPIVAHWGVTGGNFFERAHKSGALTKIDFSVVQTFSFATADPAMTTRVMNVARQVLGVVKPEEIESVVGFADAYDLTHILAKAIDLAGSTDRPAVRDALERVKEHRGLVRYYRQPFAPNRHDALTASDVFMARYRPDGTLVKSSGAIR